QLEGIGLRLEETDYEDGKEKIQNKEALFMLVNGEGEKSCYLVEPKKYELDELVEEQQRIMSLLDDNTFDYIADDRIDIELKKRRSVFCRYIYKKEEVIERALAGKAFPPKSTRHLIPDRIIRLNMRLGWLHQEPHESKEYLKNLLKNRAYNGNVRRYVEPVIVIY
ncbi:hypothetical protein JXB01_00370, partial [Candidatus Micrarchaeota archaeon]|nr:hypothetical protein [Candidatus Micrarchaeota archaeon]